MTTVLLLGLKDKGNRKLPIKACLKQHKTWQSKIRSFCVSLCSGSGGGTSKSDRNVRHTFSWLKFVALSSILTETKVLNHSSSF